MHFLIPTANEQVLWDEFLQKNGGLCFSNSTYLTATADQWGIVYNDTKTGGMACPFVEKMGQRVLVTPFFCRYVEWVGTPISPEQLIAFLKQHFQVADCQIRNTTFGNSDRVFQELNAENYQLNQQAKRSLKKAAGFTYTWGYEIDQLKQLISSELAQKIDSLNAFSLSKLERLVRATTDHQLRQLNCWMEGKWVGGLWLLKDADRMIYLKGTVANEVRKEGAMYFLMNQAITNALKDGFIFDFGGSNVANVRRFNLHFGAQDVVYSHLKWNQAPIWWKTLKFLKQQWNKK
jgi:hypothetical protein